MGNDKVEDIEVEAIEIKTPMLVYIPEVAEMLGELSLSDSDMKIFIKNAKDAGIYLIFHTPVSSVNGFRSGLGKYLKEMTRTGFVGQRSSDQTFINAKKNYSEPQMSDGEHSYFNKKTIERVRTIGISE